MTSASAKGLDDPPEAQRFTVLDSWRGLAALGVAYHHISGDYWFLDNPFHARLGLAVDFFFVLSGFVIAASYGARLRRGFSVSKFMFLRYARLWPLHVTVLAMMIALELAFFALGSLSFLEGREPFGPYRELSRLPATVLLLQEYIHPGERPWLVASWSISVEVGLYLVAALLFRFAGRGATPLGLAVAVGAGLLLLGEPLWNGSSGILRGLCGFGFGMAIHEIWLRIRDRSPDGAIASILEWAMVAALVLTIMYAPASIAAVMVFSTAILLFAFERGMVSKLLKRRGFLVLGAISYSIYLIHGMVIGRGYDVLALAQAVTGWTLVESGLGGADKLVMAPWLAALVTLAMLAGSVAAAWITWRFVEEPARAWSKRVAAHWGVEREQAKAAWK